VTPPEPPMLGSEPSEAIEEQLKAIEMVTDVALRHLDVDDLLKELLDRVASIMAVDTVAVLLLEPESEILIARAAWGIEEEVRQGVRVAMGHGFAGRIAASRKPLAIERVDSTTVTNPLLWEKGIQAMLGVPLLSGDELLGVLHVGSMVERRFSDVETRLLTIVAGRVAGAVQARQLEVERTAARVLQRSLLPSRLPSLPEFEFASRYVPAEVGGVGGDWYDAFKLEDGPLWIMVGDIVGHGMRASVVMGRLRSALRAYALEGLDPAEVVTRADRKLQFFEPGETATLMCARSRPPYDSIEISLAGHPPPVVAIGDAPPWLIDAPPDLPLGVDGSLPRSSTSYPLAPGTLLVGYTDGLIERRGRPITDGFDRLCAAVAPLPPEQVCFKVMDDLVRDDVPHDDIALLVMRRV
jgi:phosphoserine phosphatase RsbU/P